MEQNKYQSRLDEIIKLRSSIYRTDKLNVPMLIMHGGADPQVSPVHPLNLAQQPQKFGKTYELLIYAEDNHILSRNKIDREDARAVSRFRKYMKK